MNGKQVLCIRIQLEKGNLDVIRVHETDEPALLAEKFGIKHKLNKAEVAAITNMIDKNLDVLVEEDMEKGIIRNSSDLGRKKTQKLRKFQHAKSEIWEIPEIKPKSAYFKSNTLRESEDKKNSKQIGLTPNVAFRQRNSIEVHELLKLRENLQKNRPKSIIKVLEKPKLSAVLQSPKIFLLKIPTSQNFVSTSEYSFAHKH